MHDQFPDGLGQASGGTQSSNTHAHAELLIAGSSEADRCQRTTTTPRHDVGGMRPDTPVRGLLFGACRHPTLRSLHPYETASYVISYFVRSEGTLGMDGVEGIGFPLVIWQFNGFQGSSQFEPSGLALDVAFVLAVAIAMAVTLHDQSRLRNWGIARSAGGTRPRWPGDWESKERDDRRRD